MSAVPSPVASTLSGALGLLATALLCTACATLATTGAETAPEKPALPAHFEQASSAGVVNDVAPPANGDWYRGFGSDELIALIANARAHNTDLAAAQARILQADSRARAAGSGLLPSVQAGGNITRSTGRSGGTTGRETDWSGLLSASYEIDFWGRNRATSDSAQAMARASRSDREALWLTLESSIASSYFRVLSLRERLTIASDNLATARQVLQVTEARYSAGKASAVEVATQRAVVANAELVLPELQQQEAAERGVLGVLSGHDPEQFDIKGLPLAVLQEPAVTAGLPAQLLTRRPDLLAAEANLAAAHADVRAAQAAIFPTVALTANGGVQNPALQAAVLTLEGTGSTFSVGASVVQSIFDGGHRQALRAESTAREQELLANYQTAIRNALLDVETALSALQHLNQQRAAQDESLAQSTRAFEGAELRYRAGSSDYLSVLEAQRMLHVARDQVSAYRLAHLLALINLGKALGGGWQAESLSASASIHR
jgi:NodT family efflux transporter outer membrane factor (OMF) lipoprotein